MRRFVYSPSVTAYIKTDSGIVDVSPDIISGSVTRRVNAVSQAILELQNPYRKYDKRFKPMDRIVIYLTRVKPMLVFSGYLDGATMDQLYPGPVSIRASCTLKRLLYTFWDPSLSYVQAFFQRHGWNFNVLTGNIYDEKGRSLFDMDMNNGIGEMLRVVLNEVGKWPIGLKGESKNTVHVLQLPKRFLDKTETMIANQVEATEQQRRDIEKILKQLLTVEGVFSDPFTGSDPQTNYKFSSNFADTNPLPKSLAGEYKAKIYGKPITYDTSAVPASMNPEMKQARKQYGQMAANAAAKYGVPTHLFFGLIRRESGWGTISGGGVNEKNFANAHGLTQVVPPKYGYESNQILGNAALQLDIGARYLSDMYKQFKDWKLALAAYNAGPGNVQKYGGIPPFAETRAYVPAVLEYSIEEQNAAKSNRSGNTTPDGSPGEVRVGNSAFFQYNNPRQQEEGSTPSTFRIKGNPYGNDTMIFKAVKYDPKLETNEIAIYVPGNTPQAEQWTNKTVVIETSAGRAERFKKSEAAGKTPSAIDPNKMTSQELTNNGDTTKGLQAIALTGLAFIQSNFGPFRLNQGLWKPGSPSSPNGDHPKGLALDLEPVDANGNTDWGPAAVARTDALAKWAGWRPNTGGNADGNVVTRWVGWRTESGHGPGNHIHISFQGGVSPSQIPGATGGTALVSDDPLQQQLGATGVNVNQDTVAEIAASIAIGLPLVFPLVSSNFEAEYLRGQRSLMNDVPLIEFVEFMAKASGRHFQSMPNGDFLAFYPDYFNWSGQTPYLRIADIETMDLNIELSDDRLATHVFTTADSLTLNGEIDFSDKMASTVASVEAVNTFRDMVNVKDFNANEFLQRYGARPLSQDALEIKNSFMQFMYGWMTFLQHWAEMFTANPTFTFMPELYPGGVVEFASKDLVMYINGVTHNFNIGGGFTTTADLIAPSTRSKQFNYGMVLTDGGYTKQVQSRATTPQTVRPGPLAVDDDGPGGRGGR